MIGNTPQMQVTHACGHSAMRIESKRDSLNELKIRASGGTLCEACLTAHKAKRDCMISDSIQRTKEVAAATELTGSKKQIEWARRIREKWLDIVKRELPARVLFSFEKLRATDAGPEAIQQAVTAVLAVRLASIDEIVARNEAAWWIDSWDYRDAMVDQSTDVAFGSECSALLRVINQAEAAVPAAADLAQPFPVR